MAGLPKRCAERLRASAIRTPSRKLTALERAPHSGDAFERNCRARADRRRRSERETRRAGRGWGRGGRLHRPLPRRAGGAHDAARARRDLFGRLSRQRRLDLPERERTHPRTRRHPGGAAVAVRPGEPVLDPTAGKPRVAALALGFPPSVQRERGARELSAAARAQPREPRTLHRVRKETRFRLRLHAARARAGLPNRKGHARRTA